MTDAPKFCRDCRWAGPVGHDPLKRLVSILSRCLHPSAAYPDRIDMVTGESVAGGHFYCDNMRKWTACGPEATLFEPLEPAPVKEEAR